MSVGVGVSVGGGSCSDVDFHGRREGRIHAPLSGIKIGGEKGMIGLLGHNHT